MSAPIIRGRFEFDSLSQSLQIWFSHKPGVITLSAADDTNKLLRGEVPISLTGGKACAKSKLTWSEQLKGTMEHEATTLIRQAGSRGKQGDVGDAGGRKGKISLSDDEMAALLADL